MTTDHSKTRTGRRCILIVIGIVLILVAVVQWTRSRQLESRVVAAGGMLIVDDSSNGRSAFVRIRDRFTSRLMGNKDSSVHHISFDGGTVDDAWLVRNRDRIEDLSAQTWLSLEHTRVTSKGIAALRGIEDLWTLDVSGTPLSDDAIEHVLTMPDLRNLDIAKTGISDRALEGLKHHTNLQSISIDASQSTQIGIAHVADIPQLIALRLVQPTAKTIRLLPHAIYLLIADTAITPELIETFQKMDRLKQLTFETCRFVGVSEEELRESLPNCKVTVYSTADIRQLESMGLAF